ncbi:MAG: gliding motility-associated peptidyl-prolyl isomerase GldI [Flavobacteriaceae bacterium]|nr:gliding motility-associated peptidyl-prolyl isomerase GldI [Flavobacteriaceae bacterium]MDG2276164.1 gliding motility-associated peptidyl-prolyl isomerase GldI [Flavobacteriaceae bacterium]
MRLNFIFLLVFFGLNSCSEQEARAPISSSKSNELMSTISVLKEINKAEETKIKNYIKKDSLHSYISSPNGFWYRYIVKNDSDTVFPVKGDIVQVSYDLLDLNDQIIYSKETNGIKEYVVDKEDFIRGLQAGIKLMKEGESMKFIIPSFNAFGVLGDEKKIGMNTSIISRITLININKDE